MNTLRRIIEIAKANPRWARVAIALDATIGLIVGLVVYLLMNLTEVPASAVFVLLFGATLAVVGIIVFAYSIFITNGFSIEFGDGVEEGEDCPNCGQEWTGTL